MDYLPLLLDIKNKPCLVVGGGAVANRKATLLQRAGAKVNVVAPNIEPALQTLLNDCGGEYYADSYQSEYLVGQYFVIAATNNSEVNKEVSLDCKKNNILINVVDAPILCDVIFPAIIDRDPLLISVSSSGSAPVLARSVRAKIESTIPANLGMLANFIGQRRESVSVALSEQQRRLFWESLIESEIAECVMSGRIEQAEQLFQEKLTHFKLDQQPQGEVYLVGAGPGDPDLLTFKALRLMQRADVVLYDRLVSPAIVDMTRRDAERIYVGKARSDHAVPQDQINQLLIDYAQQGKKVVRLKGGDPFIFGRGGEEIAGLAEHNIPFQIVPGISAANGCACYAGIPLTHRDHAQSVRFLTGHLKDGSMDLPWHELLQDSQTLVIYMGLNGLPIICEQLMAHGKSSTTPVALIEQGTTPQQKTYTATLATINDEIANQDVHAPTLIIVGSVVELESQLRWR